MAILIAVAGRAVGEGGVRGWSSRAVAARDLYLQALGRAGAIAAVLDPWSSQLADLYELCERFDGLMLMGGPDVDPALYGQERHPEVYGISRLRDEFEVGLVKAAAQSGLPTLAICRGFQLLNVAFGGSLHQHVEGGVVDHGKVPDGDYEMHSVRVAPSSKLATLVDEPRFLCASHHHQTVDRVGEGLEPVAWADDGTIEGLETSDGSIVGVQWHPEVTASNDPIQQHLFDRFVETAGARIR